MRRQFVADDRTIINVQGVRFIEKINRADYSRAMRFELNVTYKGDKLSYQYEVEASRDAQFDRLRALLDSPPAAVAVDPHV
jgi:hypothetical protein